jgi:hypothetical protein
MPRWTTVTDRQDGGLLRAGVVRPPLVGRGARRSGAGAKALENYRGRAGGREGALNTLSGGLSSGRVHSDRSAHSAGGSISNGAEPLRRPGFPRSVESTSSLGPQPKWKDVLPRSNTTRLHLRHWPDRRFSNAGRMSPWTPPPLPALKNLHMSGHSHLLYS